MSEEENTTTWVALRICYPHRFQLAIACAVATPLAVAVGLHLLGVVWWASAVTAGGLGGFTLALEALILWPARPAEGDDDGE